MAGSREESTTRTGIGGVTVPDTESVAFHEMVFAMMVHGKSEKELDFPWHFSASKTKTQRWFFFSSFFSQLAHGEVSLSFAAAQALVVQQLLLVELQQLLLGIVDTAAMMENFAGLFRIA